MQEGKTIVIGADHAGFEYKESLKKSLEKKGWTVQDYGTDSEASMDYPDVVHKLASHINQNPGQLGILICGSGNGVAITANKYKNVRAGLAWNTNITKLVRQHNKANILAIPARFVSKRMASMMVSSFLTTEFEGGRHQRRVDKIINCL